MKSYTFSKETLEEMERKAREARRYDRKLNDKKAYHAAKEAKANGEIKLKQKSKRQLRVEAEDAETLALMKAFGLN